MNEQYVTIYEEYKQKFFQIPKVLFTNEKYVDLSNNARVVWAILRERASLSRKNNWYEKDTGRIFFIYSNKDLCEVTKIKSETTITKIKKELEVAGLMVQKVRPNRASILYLLYPILDEKDIYEIDKFEEAVHPNETPQSQQGQGTTETVVTKNEVVEQQKLWASNTDLSNTDFKDLDTLDTLDTKTDFLTVNMNGSSLSEQDEFMINAFFRNNKVPDQLGRCLKVFSDSLKEAEYYASVIYRAKKAIEIHFDFGFYLEDKLEVEMVVVDSFTRAIRNIKRGTSKSGEITNGEAYMYSCIHSALREYFTEYFYHQKQENIIN